MAPTPRRILIVRLSAIGDVINTLPAFAALRAGFPEARIGWAVEDRAAGLLETVPGLDRLHRFPRGEWSRRWKDRRALGALPGDFLAYARELRRERYDTVVDFQGNAKSALHVLLSGAPARWGFGPGHSREGSWLLLNHRLSPDGEAVNRVDKNLALAAALGAPPPPGGGRYAPPEEARREVDARLAAAGIAPPFAVLHPGTSRFGSFKRWPLMHWAAAAERFHHRTGLRLLVTWGPGERWMARSIVRGAGPAALEAPPLPGLPHLAALLQRARVVVGCDSAALHLAARLGVPTVGLYGPKDPRLYAPWGNRGEILRVGVPCSPCTRRTCEYPECMQRIEPAAVAEAMERWGQDAGSRFASNSMNP